MKYFEEKDFDSSSVPWPFTVEQIRTAVQCIATNDYVQPLKPYLRYRDLTNRIIAMPAFAGGDINMSGIKWIASFPGNLEKGIPRAHSVVILNEADTGVPVAIFNTAMISVIRTASVSGLMLSCFDKQYPFRDAVIGITGLGPIGKAHIRMCLSLLGDRVEKILVYDIRTPDMTGLPDDDRIQFVNSWQEAYEQADIFITCTVSKQPYIDIPPKKGSLHLNVSLRDYQSLVCQWFRPAIIVDNWEEVCREKTDIEMMHINEALNREQVYTMEAITSGKFFETHIPEQPVMFNPMGMAVFDIAIATYYYKTA
ncbi:MAG: 2,3-diaminopropionate biosynthesis protein SbnB [Bacteroidetes bacterium]|nr:2,3-diaminopropionate biosynthesis protein SbnB [Bacteroidota bacterium]